MGNYLKIFAIALLSTLSICRISAQENDFRIYAKGGVKFNIIEGLSNTSELEIRTKNNTSKLDVVRFNTSFGYKFNKYFSTGIGYAFITKPNTTSGTVISNRYWIDATGSISASNFTFSLRERFQQTFALKECVTLLRSELKAQYSIPESIFKPYISVEPHLFMFNELKGLKEFWYNIGTSIAINKNNDLQVYGRYTRNYNQILTSNFFLLGINYYYKF